MTPSLSLREEFNDNILMERGHKPVWGSILSPKLRWGAATERLDVQTDLSARLARYRGVQGLNTNDVSLRVDTQYTLERGRWGFAGSSIRDSTRRSELQETGRVLQERRRSLRSADGFWEKRLTEQMSLRNQYQFSNIQYAGEGEGVFDYQIRMGSVDLTYALSERDSITSGFQVLRYRSAGIQSLDMGLKVGLIHLFSKTLQTTVSIGGRQISSDSSLGGRENKADEQGMFGAFSMEKRFESALWQGGLDRSVNPSGSGSLLLVDHLFGRFRREISATVEVSLAAHAYNTRALRPGLPNRESRAFNVEPAWRLRWDEHWSMMVSYRYLWQRTSGGSSTHSNAVNWTVSYQGPKWMDSLEGLSTE